MIEAIEQPGPRERQVLELVALGYTNQQIAQALQLSEATVKGYVRTLYLKLGIQSRAQAARLWTQYQAETR